MAQPKTAHDIGCEELLPALDDALALLIRQKQQRLEHGEIRIVYVAGKATRIVRVESENISNNRVK